MVKEKYRGVENHPLNFFEEICKKMFTSTLLYDKIISDER